MIESPRSSGRIGEQNSAYRKGLVLGLTMAEVGILIIFVLLLLIVLGALKSQERDKIYEGKAAVDFNSYERLKSAEASLQAITNALGVPPDAPPDDIRELIRVLNEAAQTPEAQALLRDARGTLEEIHRTRDEIRRVLADAKVASPDAMAQQLEAQSFQVAIKEGQLRHAEKRLAALGQGNGERPCWVDSSGRAIFLYDVGLTSEGIRMRPRSEISQATKFTGLKLPSIDPNEVLTEKQFLERTQGIYDYGQRDDNQCRFHVFVFDGTQATEKMLYKQLLTSVEGHFYKQYRVVDGIPF